jgi:hypothetical protein
VTGTKGLPSSRSPVELERQHSFPGASFPHQQHAQAALRDAVHHRCEVCDDAASVVRPRRARRGPLEQLSGTSTVAGVTGQPHFQSVTGQFARAELGVLRLDVEDEKSYSSSP